MGEHEETDEPTSVTAGLPSFASYYSGEDGQPVNAALLYGSFVCKECETLKHDVVGYSLPTMFLFPHATRWDFLVKCRRCMRLHSASRLWLAVLLAHLFSPLILAWWGAVFVQTFYRKRA
jgi:hypothetical protein